MKKRMLLNLTLLFCLNTFAYCQINNGPLQTAFANLKTLLTDHIIEKAYLQFDRPYPYYLAGENVYFKAYVTMGEQHQPSVISGILHVDLINSNAAILQSTNISLTGGTGWGDFSLPENLARGTYTIRAYTNWMRNEKEPDYFYKTLSISSAVSAGRVVNNTNQSAQPSLQFFPEGGSFVSGLPSKIAFKALGADGMGLNLTGVIIDNENKEVANIKTSHLGMGTFNLVPEPGKTYKAKVTFTNGMQLIQPLPVADPSGITLTVNNDDPAKLSIGIRANNTYYKENYNKGLELIVYAGGVIREYKPVLDNAFLGLDLPVKNFKTGIVRVSLLTLANEPLNERLLFVQGDDMLSLSVIPDKQSYAKRQQVKLSLNARLKNQNAGNGSFSVSVIDESKILVDEDAGTSNLAYFLLTSEVKGNIEKPDYYFNDITQETRVNLDALMLTQAYRRFVWKQLMENEGNTAVIYKPEAGLNITGHLKTRAGKPISNCAINFFGNAGGPVYSGVTDNSGKFSFEYTGIQSASHYLLKIPVSAAKNAVLTLDDPMAPPPAGIAPLAAAYENNADILASLQSNQTSDIVTAANGNNSELLLNSDAGSLIKKTDSYRSSNIGGPGSADQVISGDFLRTSPTLSTALNGRARGVVFYSGVASLQTGIVLQNGQATLEPMQVMLDGADLGRGANIDNINPGSVETVEILKGANAAIYGVEGGQGVIVITTKQGGNVEEVETKEMSPGIFSINTPGIIRKTREFYAPAYTTDQQKNITDHRTTIFWKPDVITDANGNASFSFFNSDGTGTYRVCVEGIDSNGNLGRQVFRYQVK